MAETISPQQQSARLQPQPIKTERAKLPVIAFSVEWRRTLAAVEKMLAAGASVCYCHTHMEGKQYVESRPCERAGVPEGTRAA